MLASLVFLTPTAGFVAVAAVLPLAALALGERRVRTARTTLRLPSAPPVRLLPKVAALLATVLLLALAAAEPALRSQSTAHVRTDAQALFVLDVSRSMAAARSPSAPTRLARARQDAIAIRDALPQIPSGVATMTDRVLPSLLPSPDLGAFSATVRRAVRIGQPPPTDVEVTATTLAALRLVGTGDYFPRSARHRLVVVLTDGESRSFDQQTVARALASGPGIRLVLVHVWADGESIYDGTTAEEGYHEDPASGTALSSLAAATGGTTVSEHDLGRAIAAARSAVGSGPTIVHGRNERTRTLAPYAALLALVPLLAVIGVGRRRAFASALRVVPGRAAGRARDRRRAGRPRPLRTTR